MGILWIYYIACLVYCMVMSFRRYIKNDSSWNLGVTPGLDAVWIVMMAWIIAPIDVLLTLRRIFLKMKNS